MELLRVLTILFAAIVSLEYLVIGLYLLPRLARRTDGQQRKIALAQRGAALFLIGCGMTYALAAINTLLNGVRWPGRGTAYIAIDLVPTGLQIVGGSIFIFVVGRYLDVHFHPAGFLRTQAERERLVRQLMHLATHDELTGLLNRRAFEEAIEGHRAHVKRHGPEGAVLFIDLDCFKQLNDRRGHRAGDQALRDTAAALRANIRTTDVVGRLGGDEFAVLLRDAGPQEARGTAERVVRAVDRVPHISASVGVAPWAVAGDALADADAAMYQAKRQGGNRYVPAEAATA